MADEMCSARGGIRSLNSEHLTTNSEHLTTNSEHLTTNSEHLTTNSEHLAANSEHLATLREIAEPVRSQWKTPKTIVEATILHLCEEEFLTLEDLADLLNRTRDTLRNHYINPMLDDGRLEAKYKNIRTHPRQGYRTVSGMEMRGEQPVE